MWRQTRTYILGNEGKLVVETWRVLSETLTKTQFLLLVGSYTLLSNGESGKGNSKLA